MTVFHLGWQDHPYNTLSKTQVRVEIAERIGWDIVHGTAELLHPALEGKLSGSLHDFEGHMVLYTRELPDYYSSPSDCFKMEQYIPAKERKHYINRIIHNLKTIYYVSDLDKLNWYLVHADCDMRCRAWIEWAREYGFYYQAERKLEYEAKIKNDKDTAGGSIHSNGDPEKRMPLYPDFE